VESLNKELFSSQPEPVKSKEKGSFTPHWGAFGENPLTRSVSVAVHEDGQRITAEKGMKETESKRREDIITFMTAEEVGTGQNSLKKENQHKMRVLIRTTSV